MTLTPIKSSNVRAVGVDGADLIVAFIGGTTYRYRDAATHFGAIVASESPGRAVRSLLVNCADLHPATQLTEAMLAGYERERVATNVTAAASYIGATVEIDEHITAVQRYGPGPPAPGWYAHAGFRTSPSADPILGPESDLGAIRRALLWRAAHRDPWFDPSLVVSMGPAGNAAYLRDGLNLLGLGAQTGTGFYRPYKTGFEIFEPLVVIGVAKLRALLPIRIDSFVKLECAGGMMIGQHVHIASFCHLGIGGGLVLLENGSSFGSGAKIISGSNLHGLGHGCSAIAPDARFNRSFVHVKKNATLFTGATVLPGVTVGENAVVAAGAVVRCDVPDREIWGGIPAQKIGEVQ